MQEYTIQDVIIESIECIYEGNATLKDVVAMQGSKIEALEKKVNQIGRQRENQMNKDTAQCQIEVNKTLIELIKLHELYWKIAKRNSNARLKN